MGLLIGTCIEIMSLVFAMCIFCLHTEKKGASKGSAAYCALRMLNSHSFLLFFREGGGLGSSGRTKKSKARANNAIFLLFFNQILSFSNRLGAQRQWSQAQVPIKA